MPFRGKSIEEILSENKKGEVNFDIPELGKASNDVLDLLKGMLKVNLAERFSIKQALDHRFFKLRMEEFKDIKDILTQLNFKDYEELKNALNKYGKETTNPTEIPKALASFLGSSLYLNIQDNALKGQVQSYLSNPDSVFKLPSLDVSTFKKNEQKNNTKNDILSKYVNTEENKIDENSLDKEYDFESKSKSELEEKASIEKIRNKSPKTNMRKSSGDEFRKKAIMNQIKKNHENDEESNPFNIKLSKV